MMLFGAAGCAPKSGSEMAATGGSSYEPGVYQAEAEGKGGTLTVQTTFSENAIDSVEVIEHGETRFVSDMALERIPADIVEYQSLGIDTITGATLTSMAILSAVGDCASQAGGDVSALKATPGAEKTDEVVDIDADLVIAGAGSSGMACAIAAAQEGAKKVVVLEKTSNMGGNALVSGGYIEHIYAPQDLREKMTDGYRDYFERIVGAAEEAGVDPTFTQWIRDDFANYYAEGYDTVYSSNELYNLELAITDGGGDFSDVSTERSDLPYDQRSIPLNDWLDDMGIEWAPLVGIVGYPWPHWSGVVGQHCGDGYFDLFTNEIADADLPIELITLTTANELIIENGKVVGMVGLCDDGTTYRVRASKGVVLATGGFSGNEEMMREYNTMWKFDDQAGIPTTNAYGHTGDGHRMAKEAGAALELMDQEMLFPFADRKNYSTETIVGDTGNCLLVNENGVRFVDESRSRFEIAGALMDQPNDNCFVISDVNNCKIVDGVTQFKVNEQFLIDHGQLYRADSLDELAEQMGVDAATLKATVEAYNKAATTTNDPEFGRTTFTESSPITDAPFYASPRTWAAHITIGGVVIDDQWRALNEQGEPIDGLYVIGECILGDSGIAVMSNGLDCARKIFA